MERGASALSQVWHDEGPMVVGGAPGRDPAGSRAGGGEVPAPGEG